MTGQAPLRCAERADLRGDAMLGTAFPAARLLLVEQPGPWGRAGLRESRFDPTTAVLLERRANAAGIRVQAIRRPGRTPPGTHRRWALADTRGSQPSLRWGTYEHDEQLLELDLDAAAGEPDPEPVYLVCAHSKHDACCAVRGRAVAAALAAVRPGRVWECSHVGGDRFAANVLVLPAGLLYGRVPAAAALGFATAADRDEVLPGLLRGRVGLSGPAQAALAYAHQQLRIRRRAELRVTAATPVEGGAATVRLQTPLGPHEVRVVVERVAADGLTCANPRPNEYLRYRPVTITAVR